MAIYLFLYYLAHVINYQVNDYFLNDEHNVFFAMKNMVLIKMYVLYIQIYYLLYYFMKMRYGHINVR